MRRSRSSDATGRRVSYEIPEPPDLENAAELLIAMDKLCAIPIGYHEEMLIAHATVIRRPIT